MRRLLAVALVVVLVGLPGLALAQQSGVSQTGDNGPAPEAGSGEKSPAEIARLLAEIARILTEGMDKSAPKRGSGQTDRLIFKNGDVLSGEVLNQEFSLQTSYASISLPLREIESITFNSRGSNVATVCLTNGDRISGLVGPANLRLKLASGQEVEFGQDKLNELKAKERGQPTPSMPPRKGESR